MSQNMPLVAALQDHLVQKRVRLHMPGHKGSSSPTKLTELVGQKAFAADFTELPGLDDLHNPQGVIAKAQELAAVAFGADASYFLVNGATAGIEAALLACFEPGDLVIAPRNMHRSFLNGLILSGTKPVYIPTAYTAQGIPLPVQADQLKKVIAENPGAKGIFVVSPTYEGLCINYGELLPIARAAGLKVLVDEAHGAHFYFHDQLPKPSLHWGADVVIHGSHKTLGSFTQTGMLHVTHLEDTVRIQKALSILQSTSPSYLLMASLDAARSHAEQCGQKLFQELLALCQQARTRINHIPDYWCLSKEHLKGWPGLEYDPTKLVIGSQKGLSGYQLFDILGRSYRLDLEMARQGYVLALVGLGDNSKNLEYLIKGLKNVAKEADIKHNQKQNRHTAYPALPQVVLAPREAYFAGEREVALEEAEGEVSAEMLAPYPPGVPLICPGERFTSEIISYIQEQRLQTQWQGAADASLKRVRIIEQ